VQTLQTLADNGDFRASALLAKVALQATLYWKKSLVAIRHSDSARREYVHVADSPLPKG
jgi:hypothetical protein